MIFGNCGIRLFRYPTPSIFTFKKGLSLSVVQKAVLQFTCQLQVEAMCVWTHCNVNNSSLRHTNSAQYTLHVLKKNSVKYSSLIIRMHQNLSSNVNLFLLQSLWQELSHVTDEDLQTRDRGIVCEHVYHM